MALFLPDPRDDLGGMDVARKVSCLSISHLISGVLFVTYFLSELLCIAWTAAVLSLFVSY
jgi:hypothetical protein